MKKSWRKIIIDDVKYVWCLPGDDGYSDNHILVHLQGGASNLQVLNIDTTTWGIEIRPKTVSNAIKFALANNWKPEEKGKSLYIGHDKDFNFIVFPPNIKFSYKITS